MCYMLMYDMLGKSCRLVFQGRLQRPDKRWFFPVKMMPDALKSLKDLYAILSGSGA